MDDKDQGCPETYETCIRLKPSQDLATYLSNVRSWMDEAWRRCGEAPKGLPKN